MHHQKTQEPVWREFHWPKLRQFKHQNKNFKRQCLETLQIRLNPWIHDDTKTKQIKNLCSPLDDTKNKPILKTGKHRQRIKRFFCLFYINSTSGSSNSWEKFFTEKFQPLSEEGMLEYHHVDIPNEWRDLGNDQQLLLNWSGTLNEWIRQTTPNSRTDLHIDKR